MKVNKSLLNGTVAYYFIPILIVMFSLQIVVAESESINEKLWDAVDVEDESLVKQFLEQGADGGAVVDRGGLQIENLKFNKEGGMSVEYMYSADTALKQAVNKGSSALVRLLLEAGVEDEDNADFIHAVRSLHTDVVRDFLITHSDNMHGWDKPHRLRFQILQEQVSRPIRRTTHEVIGCQLRQYRTTFIVRTGGVGGRHQGVVS